MRSLQALQFPQTASSASGLLVEMFPMEPTTTPTSSKRIQKIIPTSWSLQMHQEISSTMCNWSGRSSDILTVASPTEVQHGGYLLLLLPMLPTRQQTMQPMQPSPMLACLQAIIQEA